jgi:glucose/sorbosone dehydrogenase
MAGDRIKRWRWSLLAAATFAVAVLCVVLLSGRAAGKAPTLALHSIGAFHSPVYIAHAPGTAGFLYVVEQGGTIRVVDHGSVKATPFLDIHRRVLSGGEEDGLLSMAFDPRYRSNHLFYVAYTRSDGALEVDEFHASSNLSANKYSRRQVIVVPHPGAYNHNGGQLQFGPDGYLYISTGDGGREGDQFDNARHLDILLGKLLRINPHRRGASPYTVPPSNPYVGRPGRDEIFSYGFRNPWRFSFDSANGDLAIADVGENKWEEIDYVTRSRAWGSYFGWPTYEGLACFQSCNRRDPNPNPRPPIFPIGALSHNNGYCAIIGGYVVHNPNLSLLNNRYVYGDLCSGQIRSLVPSTSGGSGDSGTGLNVSSPSSFGVGAAGQLYVASLGNGRVYQIVQQP